MVSNLPGKATATRAQIHTATRSRWKGAESSRRCTLRRPGPETWEASGNEGYAEEADALTIQYESVHFVDLHGPVLHLLPTVPSDVLDIGAGTGRDAAALAGMGH